MGFISAIKCRFVKNHPPETRPAPRAIRQPSAAEAFSVPALERAFLRVRANGGGPGGDGVTSAVFDRNRAERLGALSAALITGVYRPGPLKRHVIGKAGARRQLAVPCIADRTAQTAWLFALGPSLEARMHPRSFAYRSGRGVRDAVKAAEAEIAAGRANAAKADITKFFDNVPHAQLFAALPRWAEAKQMRLLAMQWVRHASPGGKGLPQGSPLSPALANIFLDPFDKALAAEGIAFVRYADDIALFCGTAAEARAALARAGQLLAARGLELNRTKCFTMHAGAGIPFLGETLRLKHGFWRRALRRLKRLFRRAPLPVAAAA